MNLQDLINEIRPLYNGADPAHDFSHIMRVFKLCKEIGRKEGADLDILLMAALLHDVGCDNKTLGNPEESNERSLTVANGVLEGLGYSEEDIGRILYAVEVHGYSKGVIPETLEGQVLQDADRLDAMGAVGIARTFLVGGTLNRPMYDPDDPFCQNREPDQEMWNLDHFYQKLLKLEDGMHTATGAAMARERAEVLTKYLEDLKKEIG
jgi:uncharacterized protein